MPLPPPLWLGATHAYLSTSLNSATLADGPTELSFPASLAKDERAWIHNQCKVNLQMT